MIFFDLLTYNGFIKISYKDSYETLEYILNVIDSCEYDYSLKTWSIPYTFFSNTYNILKEYDKIEISKRLHDFLSEKKLLKEKIEWIKSLDDDYFKNNLKINHFFNSHRIPHNYQKKAILLLYFAKTYLLADDVGLGKSIQATGTALLGRDKGKINHCLIVCPATLKWQWRDEILEYVNPKHFPDIDKNIIVIEGPKEKRKKLYQKDSFFKIINFNLLYRDIDFMPENMDMIAVDEAAYMKSIDTLTSKSIKRYAKMAKTKIRIAMTATAIENGLGDYFSIMEFIDPMLLGTLDYFKSKFCIIKPMRIKIIDKMQTRIQKKKVLKEIKIQKTIDYKNIPYARKRTELRVIRRTSEDVQLEIPKIIFSNFKINLTTKQKRTYKKVKEDSLEELKSSEGSLLAKIVYFREICDDIRLIGLESKNSDSAKLMALKDLFEGDLKDQSVIIFTQFEKFIKYIIEVIGKDRKCGIISGPISSKNRQKTKKDFNDGKIDTLIMTDAGKTGLNLQTATVVINIELPWNPAVLHQRVGRMARQGNKSKTVKVINLIARNTIEEKVLSSLIVKQQLFNKILSNKIDKDNDDFEIKMSTKDFKDMI